MGYQKVFKSDRQYSEKLSSRFVYILENERRLRSVRNIGNLQLPAPDKGDYVNFIIDGQQRITSIFAALEGVKVTRVDGKEEDFSEIYIDLEAKNDEKIVTTEIDGKDPEQIIKLKDLLYGGLTFLTSKVPEKYHKKLEQYKRGIESYNYSIIQVNDAPIDVATEIFTRVNVGGERLSLFEIMVAKTYDEKQNFDLAEKFNLLISDLKAVNYETISDASVLQIISLILTKESTSQECKSKTILNLKKETIIAIWDEVVDSIKRAIDYFIGYYRIPVSQLLPYNSLLVPFAYFFYYHKDRPTGNAQKYLEDFFWRVSLSGRYSSGSEGKLAQDVKRIDKILRDEMPDYDWSIDFSQDFIKRNGWFSAGRSYVKAILCIYAYHQPKSFIDNSVVHINNYWLKQSNSRNYHHFFPTAYLEKQNVDDRIINHILNITIVDDYLNKKKIRDKAPSLYMKEFEDVNIDLPETMKTHLITNLEEFGVWSDDYQLFINKRATAISEELRKRLINRAVDKKQQQDLVDDMNEDSEELEIKQSQDD